MIDQYNNELDMIKYIYDESVMRYNAENTLQVLPVDSKFPPVSGALTWVARLKDRIAYLKREIAYLEHS